MDLLCIIQLAVEPVFPEEAALVCVHDGVADGAAEAGRVPRLARHLEDVPVGDQVAAERALVALGLKKQTDHVKNYSMQVLLVRGGFSRPGLINSKARLVLRSLGVIAASDNWISSSARE